MNETHAPQAITGGDPRLWFDRVPFMKLLGMQRNHSQDGRAQLVLHMRAELGNVIGSMHGGAVATLLDVAMASAAVSARNFQCTAVTLNMNSAFITPGRGLLTADAVCLGETDGVAWCSAEVTDETGHTVARAQGSFRYLPLPVSPASPESPESPDPAASPAPIAATAPFTAPSTAPVPT